MTESCFLPLVSKQNIQTEEIDIVWKVTRNVAIILTIMLSGCASKWARLDGGPIVQTELQEARAICQIDEKLEQIEVQRNIQLRRANSNEAKMLAKDDFTAEESAAYAEINACMQQLGYREAD